MGKHPNPTLVVLCFFSIYVIWGSTYLWNKIAVTELPPFMLAGMRFVVAGLLIFLIVALMRKNVGVTLRQLLNTFIAGFLFLSIGNGFAVWALQYIDSSFEALIISAQPLVILLMMWLLQGRKIQLMSMVGVVLGFLGIYLLVSQKALVQHENFFLGVFLVFLALLAWGYGSLFVGRADLPKNFFVNTGYQMLFGGLTMLLISFIIKEEWSGPWQWSTKVQGVMVLLIVFGSIIAFTSFNYLLKHVSPEKVATSTYVNPIVAMFLGWYFLNEQITLQSIIAAIVLFMGVYFINSKKKWQLFSRFKKVQ
ncbi:EamA family transporter [Allomuricauda sp. SCSIO 65647]|uniref:EamA family transporter n=1 Tax=Allomuricauda sp. SCSIO 65647 TaxID=2908843 RepID=UPI001F3092A8|nr:EamA family transporter [Muricauda sp. SCSIO 65647]UJH67327.1 EamA family transporter [Muricauda sp. SCSIO 65647]